MTPVGGLLFNMQSSGSQLMPTRHIGGSISFGDNCSVPVNYLAIRKIVKKHDKCCSHPGFPFFEEVIDPL